MGYLRISTQWFYQINTISHFRWILGGSNDAGNLKSTEVFDPRSMTFSKGPDLPYPASRHCVVAINDTHYFFANGGENENQVNSHHLKSTTEKVLIQQNFRSQLTKLGFTTVKVINGKNYPSLSR